VDARGAKADLNGQATVGFILDPAWNISMINKHLAVHKKIKYNKITELF